MSENVLAHPAAGQCSADRTKVAIRWADRVATADREALLETAGLVPVSGPEPREDSRAFSEVNNSDALTWVESSGRRAISVAALRALEESSFVRWIARAYRREDAPEGLEGLFCVNPAVLILRARAAEAVGDVQGISPSLSIDSGRTESLHGLTVLNVAEVSLVEGRDSVHAAEALAARLEETIGLDARDIVFENIPLIRPTCASPSCAPALVEFLPNDPLFPGEWGMRRISAPRAWPLTQGDSDIIVAVIDQGVELAHPDLDIHPLSWNATTHTPGGGPVGNHGTACAGIVAGTINNALGVTGVAGRCRIMAIATSTWADTDIVESLYFAADHGARVVSMSFGVYAAWGFWNFAIIQDALQYAYDKGLVLVAASGNENIAQSRFPGSDARTICVGGSNRIDVRKRVGDTSIEAWWGACYGPDLDVVAPCLEIPTTDRLGGMGYSPTDYYDRFNGTSSATPHVAGLAGLILSLRPDLTNEQVREIIERTCDKISPDTYAYGVVVNKPHGTWNSEVGYGRINVERALLAACNRTRPGGEDPCAVELPETPDECVSPPSPPWKPLDQCLYWYETRFVSGGIFQFRVIYEHCMKLLGRQQGPLVYTTTLLPGESRRVFESDRYRRTRATKDVYTTHTSFRQSVAALQQSRFVESRTNYQELLARIRAEGDTSLSIGGGLFPVSWDAQDATTLIVDYTSARLQTIADSFQQTVRTASYQVEAERSITVSTFEDREHLDVTTRELKNANDCYAVTYFARRVYEAYELSTRVIAIDWRLLRLQALAVYPKIAIAPAPTVAGATTTRLGEPWRSTDDLRGLDDRIRKELEAALLLLPRVGEVVQDPRPVSVPTDGILYEAELAHCASCEPGKLAEHQIALERQKAEERKVCLEAELLAAELRRRELLLGKGDLGPFEARAGASLDG